VGYAFIYSRFRWAGLLGGFRHRELYTVLLNLLDQNWKTLIPSRRFDYALGSSGREHHCYDKAHKVAVVILRHLYMPQEQRNGLSVPRWKLPWDEKIDHGGLA